MTSADPNIPDPAGRWSLADTVTVALLLGIALMLLDWSWARWLHPIIDSGRDLYIPEQLLAGKKLYRDIRYFYPPLTPYLLAVATAIIGSGLGSYSILGLAASSITATAMFLIGRMFGGRWTAAAAVFLAVTWSFTGATARGCNFFFPYAHAATFGMLFFLVFMLMLGRFVFDGGTTRSFGLALAFGLAAGWSKIEFGAFVTVATIAALAFRRLAFADPLSRLSRLALTTAACVAATFAIASAVYSGAAPGHHWFFDNVYWTPLITGPVTRRFYLQVIGLDHWRSNLLTSGLSAVLLSVIVYCAVLVSRSETAQTTRRRITTAAALIATLLVSVPLANQRFFRAWAVLQIVIGIVAVIRLIRLRQSGEAADADLRLLFLLLFALCGASRIYLNLAPIWYGFVFILPTDIFIAYALFAYGPSIGLYTRRAALIWLIPIVLVGARGVQEQRAVYSSRVFPIATARGTFFDDVRDRAAALNGVLEYIGRRGAKSLVVMPEGVALNYFLRIPDPLSYNTFSAAEIANREVERNVIAEFEQRKPELVALNNQFVEEFGVPQFGRGYGQEILAYLNAHYAVEKRWPSSTFSLVLLRRVR